MATTTAPIVSLQSPKDVSLGEIEGELAKIWQSYNAGNEDGSFPVATRAATFSLVIYEPEETQQLLSVLGFYSGPVDGITGPRTKAAVKAAQTAYGLPVTGKADAATIERLRQAFLQQQAVEDSARSTVQPLNTSMGVGMADAIASQNPCRIVALCPMAGMDQGVTAQVSAYCPVQKQSRSSLICGEYITLQGTTEALERVGDMVAALVIPELPQFLWWKATPDVTQPLFQTLTSLATCTILDSSGFVEPEADLLKVYDLLQQGTNVADLNWRRLAAWQELTAEAFDPPERRVALKEVDQVTIDYEKGNISQAIMFLGWLASRLSWQPVSYTKEGGEGDYDIGRVKFLAADNRPIHAELAGVPVGDVGDVEGDLIGLRLMSTNEKADCCTILCSETTGCMRMEAGGSAQSCSIRQVTSLTDQEAEDLLSQQLQRWGREMLYEESMMVTAQILQLALGA
jgi:glucose-6-phosphate dehydrogenase assembly protein OpcA